LSIRQYSERTDMDASSSSDAARQQDGDVVIRSMSPDDAESCGRVAFAAHQAVALAHNFLPEHSSVDFSIGLMRAKISDKNAYGALAENGGQIVGSIFLNTFPPAPVAAIGPLTVDPAAAGGVGKMLMETAMKEARRRGYENVRLVQSPSHLRSLVLYTKSGFAVREPLILMQGAPSKALSLNGQSVREATQDDLLSCNGLCSRVHNFSREFELRLAIEQRVAVLVERDGKIVAYAAGVGLRGHAVAETVEDLKAVICASPKLPGPGFFVPARNNELLRWLLEAGARALWPAALMTFGSYQEPVGAFLPSIAF
jgi:predicted N-acetyltransferase YhbS